LKIKNLKLRFWDFGGKDLNSRQLPTFSYISEKGVVRPKSTQRPRRAARRGSITAQEREIFPKKGMRGPPTQRR
jgi:hypothetical protein